eukprot:4048418-Karenia_brevis.AAC.1
MIPGSRESPAVGKKSWIVRAVTHSLSKHVRKKENRFENLVYDEDEDEEEVADEVCSIPSLESSDDEDDDQMVGPSREDLDMMRMMREMQE